MAWVVRRQRILTEEMQANRQPERKASSQGLGVFARVLGCKHGIT